MVEIVQTNGRPVIDYMARDYDSLLKAMHDAIPAKLPEWTDFTNQADFGNALLELFAHVGDILSYYQDRIANESFLGTARTRRSVIQHLQLIGYKLKTAAPAAAKLQVTVKAAVNDVVTVSAGDAFATKSLKNKASVRFEYTGEQPLTINFAALNSIDGKKTFTEGIPVEEGRSIKSETIGTSNGRPNQRFPLAHAPLILRPVADPVERSNGQETGTARSPSQPARPDIALLTRLGAKTTAWTLRETLAFSRAGQQDFTVEIDDLDQATITFGDGSFGAIPPAGAAIEASYRVGGGGAGNVPKGAISTIVGAPQLALLAAQVTNPEAATGGADRESIDHAVQHAPAVFRSLQRAVTATDYEALAGSFNGVGKVRAKATGWNTVVLYVAPTEGGCVSDVLRHGLTAYFEDKRMVSQMVEVRSVDYVPIYVTAQIGIESYYSPERVMAAVERAAGALLDFGNVDFGQKLYLSKIYEAAESVPGVRFVNVVEFQRGPVTRCGSDEPPFDHNPPKVEPLGKIELGADQLPKKPDAADYASGIKVIVMDVAAG